MNINIVTDLELNERPLRAEEDVAINAIVAQEAVNIEAKNYLASTDWYVVRFTETGIPIPLEVSTKRQETREAILDATLITGEI